MHNTIHDTKYSGICAGVKTPAISYDSPPVSSASQFQQNRGTMLGCFQWGWGLSSYTRNIQIENNSITKVMQLLSDGGGVCAHGQPAV